MGTRVEQSSEFLPRASRTSRRHLEDMADSLHGLPSAAEDLQVIIPRCNRTLLLQGEFCLTLPACTTRACRSARTGLPCADPALSTAGPCWSRPQGDQGGGDQRRRL